MISRNMLLQGLPRLGIFPADRALVLIQAGKVQRLHVQQNVGLAAPAHFAAHRAFPRRASSCSLLFLHNVG